MKSRIFISIVLLFCIAVPTICMAQEEAHLFVSAMEAYKKEDYTTAITNLETIAQKGIRNGALFYNLGNAYLKNNDLGRAILWYERALKLLPSDPDLRFNYDYARSLTRDATEENAHSLVRIFFFWKYQLSRRTITILAIGLNFLFWSLLIARSITRRKGFKHAAAAIFIPGLIFILTAAFNYYEATDRNEAIVLSKKVSIRSGLENTSTELFVLHAGAKIEVVKQMKKHLQIMFSRDKIGWVENKAVGII